MWVTDKTGKYSFVHCDICDPPKTGEVQVRIGNIIVAEVCPTHGAELTRLIQSRLKTRPGVPDSEPPQKG